jgi:hypothetical protein
MKKTHTTINKMTHARVTLLKLTLTSRQSLTDLPPLCLILGVFLGCRFIPSNRPIPWIDHRPIGVIRLTVDRPGWIGLTISQFRGRLSSFESADCIVLSSACIVVFSCFSSFDPFPKKQCQHMPPSFGVNILGLLNSVESSIFPRFQNGRKIPTKISKGQ